MRRLSRLCLAVLVAPACGCMEFMGGHLERQLERIQRASKFERACAIDVDKTVRGDAPGSFKAYAGAVVPRQDVAVVVVPPVSNRCLADPHISNWTLYIVSVDERREVLGPDVETGGGGLVRLPAPCSDCHECFRLALMPGIHLIALEIQTDGSVAAGRKPAILPGSVQFQAQAGGLYSIHACQPRAQKQPLFWVRDEGTRGCVSTTCPEAR